MSGPLPDGDASMAWYLVGDEIRDRALAERVSRAVLDVLRPRTAAAVIDAYTDFRKTITAEANAAEDALWAKGSLRRTRDPGMNVELDPSNEDDWTLLACYAPWSINVDLYDTSDALIGSLHDCAYVIDAELSADDVSRLAAELGDAIPIQKMERTEKFERSLERIARQRGKSREHPGGREADGTPLPWLRILRPRWWQRHVWRWPVITPPTVPPKAPPTFNEPDPKRED